MVYVDEMESVGISSVVLEYIDAEPSYNGTAMSYVCEYPPIIADDDTVFYHRVRRHRFLKSHIEKNPKSTRFANPTSDNLPNGRMPPIYTPSHKDLKFQVQAHNGVIHLCEGDKDTWTMFECGRLNSAGIIAASSSLGDDFVRALKDLGVKVIRLYPDADNSGWNMAERMRDTLEGSGIRLNVYHLPLYYDDMHVKDINDLWNATGYDMGEFNRVLDDLRTIVLPTNEQLEHSKDRDEIFDSLLYEKIEDILGVNTYSGDGWSEAVPCPFQKHAHDDIRPAFGWHKKMHVGRCFKCGETWLTKDVAEALDIRWRDYLSDPNEKPVGIKDKPKPQVERAQNAATTMNALSRLRKGGQEGGRFNSTPSDSFMYTLDDALDNYTKRLKGAIRSEYPAILNPFSLLHQLEGNGLAITRPSMIGILGLSGGFKTSLMFHMVNILLNQGYSGIMWTPEWLPEKNADRIVQQFGGLSMTEMKMLDRYYFEQDMIERGIIGEDDPMIFGRKPDEEKILYTEHVLNVMRERLRGKLVYIKKSGLDAITFFELVEEAYGRMTDAGHQPTFLVVDYAQLMETPIDYRGKWDLTDTIALTKNKTEELGLATFISSQVRKADSQAATERDRDLDATSGLNFHDHKFNLFWAQRPVEAIVQNSEGTRHFQIVQISVTKNSEGKKAKGDQSLEIYVDLERLVAYEDPDDPNPLYIINPDDPDLQFDEDGVLITDTDTIIETTDG